jgi:hypothetical protein
MNWRKVFMKLADAVYNFFAANKSNGRDEQPKERMLPTFVLRTPDIAPNPDKRRSKLQPKVERDLVKAGNLPKISKEEYNKVYQGENMTDAPTASYLDPLKDALLAEEGFMTRGYVPTRDGRVIGKSGVTVGKGFDLGQFNAAQLKKMGIEENLLKKLKPYIGVKGEAAVKRLKTQPLELDELDAEKLSDLVFSKKIPSVESTIKDIEKASGKPLSDNQKVALGLMIYQGVTPQEFPNSYRLLKDGYIDKAANAFRKSKWAKTQTPNRAHRVLTALLNDISPREAEDLLVEQNIIKPNERVFTTKS